MGKLERVALSGMALGDMDDYAIISQNIFCVKFVHAIGKRNLSGFFFVLLARVELHGFRNSPVPATDDDVNYTINARHFFCEICL